jgi:hypothetical protein
MNETMTEHIKAMRAGSLLTLVPIVGAALLVVLNRLLWEHNS